MTIPDYQQVMTPLLEFTADQKDHTLGEAYEALADRFKLSAEERTTLLPSGKQAIFDNRVGWAKTYLVKAVLLEQPRRGVFRITQRGLETLAEHKKTGAHIDTKFLETIPEFAAFRENSTTPGETGIQITPALAPMATLSPEEMLESGYAGMRRQLASELIDRVRAMEPAAFEQLVVDLLLAMGYGGSRKEAGRAIGRTADGGVDGVIEQDRLGLDVVYVQAKRWQSNVGSPEIRDFAGALGENKVSKGIFITTSGFSKEAAKSAEKAEKRIIRIDGIQLAELLIDYNVGVAPGQSYQVKRLDLDYFIGE